MAAKPELKKKYDVIVIGSGAGGASVADYLLHNSEKNILMLESGPMLTRKDFNQRELDMSANYFNRGAMFSENMNISVAAGNLVGGSTAVYTGVSFRAPATVLTDWRETYGLDFLTEDYATARFNEIEKDLHVHLPPPDFDNHNNRLFYKGCEAMGIQPKRLKLNIKGCKKQGFCNLGCTSGAKQGALEVQLPRMQKKKNFTLVYNAFVDSVAEGKVRFSIVAARENTQPNEFPEKEYTIEADKIVIAAGAIHTPALLLRSVGQLGLKNSNVGRYLTLHPVYNVNAVHHDHIDNYRGFPKTWYVDDFSETEGYYLETSFYYPGVTAKNLPGFGNTHRQFMLSYNKMMSILILAHDKAIEDNRIDITRKGRVQIHYRVTDKVRQSLAKALIKSAQIFFSAGCEKALFPGSSKTMLRRADYSELSRYISAENMNFAAQPLSSAHPQGGARMSADEKLGVTGTDGKVYGTETIYVADASLFPDSVHVNPYETVMLMAQHVARQMV